MSTKIDSSLFVDVADAIGLGNPSIVEKDYYVVQLLKLISEYQPQYHQMVFTGGTALSKSIIKTYRMSEDVDMKLVPNREFGCLPSGGAKKAARKAIKQCIENLIINSDIFSIDGEIVVRNQYRYFSFNLRYPQVHQQSPCLRPFIKIEFIESKLLELPDQRAVQSIYAELLQFDIELEGLVCAAITETQAEKLVSMTRRTASVARNYERDDDKALIRHIYDTYQIQQAQPSDIKSLRKMVVAAINLDVERFGKQHPQMVENPIDELRFGLKLLNDESRFKERYQSYVNPMVYAESPVHWNDALAVFSKLANEVFDGIKYKHQ